MLAQVFWNSPRSLPVAVAVAVLTVAAVIWLYPPQVKGLAWRWRWGLPMLRAAGMLTLAAALLKPTVLRPKTSDEQGAVVVLVDRSRSMSVADNARTPAQLVALADGLGRLPRGLRSDVAAGVAARVARARPHLAAAERAWGDLEYARVAGRGVEAARERVEHAAAALREAARSVAESVAESGATPPGGAGAATAAPPDAPSADDPDARAKLAALRAAFDAAAAGAARAQATADEQLYLANPAVKAACDALASASRFSLVEEALLRPGSGLVDALGAGARVVGFAVADELTPLPLVAQGAAPASNPTTTPAAPPPSTALSRRRLGVEPVGRRSDVAGSVRKAVEILGGADVAAVVLLSDGRQAGAEAAVTSGLGASGVPVFAVAAAPAGAVRDVALGAVTAPASAFVGETITVRAEVRPQGVRDGEVRVKLAAEGVPEQGQSVKFAEGRPAVAEFQLKATRPGAQALAVSIEGVPGEATGENNAARRWVKVASQKVKVAAYGAPGWDFQYLRNALVRTPWVELQAGVLNPAAPRVSLAPDQVLEQEVLILSDVPVAALDESQWGAVYRLVEERGGSVILVAGPAHAPLEYGPHFVASLLLPYAPEMTPTWRMWPGEEPMFRLVPHPDAAGESFLRIGGGPALSGVQRWQMLPGFFRVLPVGRLKPSAGPLLVEASSGEPVLSQLRVGAGRSFLFGADETWRWRFPPGGDVHDQFWLQLTRYAAGEPYAARSQRLALDVDQVAFEAGESVQARVRSFGGGSRDTLRLEVTQRGAVFRTLTVNPVGGGENGRFRARVGALPEGDYELRLSEANAGDPSAPTSGAVSLPLHVTAGYEAELMDVSGDEGVLTRLAEASGGEVYALDQLGQLADRLRNTTERRSRFVEQRLWDSPYLFVLVVACFAAEWAARKRVGLA